MSRASFYRELLASKDASNKPMRSVAMKAVRKANPKAKLISEAAMRAYVAKVDIDLACQKVIRSMRDALLEMNRQNEMREFEAWKASRS